MTSVLSPIKLILYLSFCFFAHAYLGNTIEFDFELAGRDRICLVEDLAEKTFYTVICHIQDPLYNKTSIEILGPNKKTISRLMDRSHYKASLTAKESGAHKMCISNNGNKLQRITFKLIQDAEVALTEGILNKAGKMPLWTDIISIQMRTEHIKKMGDLMLKLENEKYEAVDDVYETLTFFGFGFACMTLFISYVQYKILKNFLSKKKLI